jgi:hypothetical protein
MYYTKMFSECKNDLKTTWKLIREVTCSRKMQSDKLPEYFRHEGGVIKSPNEIANQFNKYFSEVGPNLAAKIPSSSKDFTEFLGAPNEQEFKFTEMSEMRILNFMKI